MSSRTFIEMRWRCGACSVENLGRFGDCQTCRKPREDEPYYDAGAAPLGADEVNADPALRQEAYEAPDWQCTRCGTSQQRSAATCAQCGAEQTAAAAVDDADPIAPPAGLAMPSRFVTGDPADRAKRALTPPRRASPLVREVLWGSALFVAIVSLGVLGWFYLR